MKRRVALLALLVSLLSAGAAHGEGVALPPHLLPSRLLTEVGEPVPVAAPFRSGFVLPDRDGYEVRVFTSGSAVILEVMRGGQRRSAVSAYVARGIAGRQRLQATFGQLGSVSMRFRRPGRQRRPQSFCRGGRRFSRQPGVFVGRFAFKGEGGYLSVALHRAKGAIVTPDGRCPRRRFSKHALERLLESLFEPFSGLEATSRDGVASTSFVVFKQKRKAFYYASREETLGRLAIIRFAVADARRGFSIDETAARATVSPPSPFRGTGRYRAQPDGSTTWTGGLSVNFPGAPRFPLAGAGFQALLEAQL